MPYRIQLQRRAGRAWVVALVVVVALAMIAGVTVYLMRDTPAPPSQGRSVADVDAQIEALQNSFKLYTENNQDFNNLLPEVKQFADAHPDRPDGLILLGQVYMKLELWEAAFTPLNQALSIEPDFYQLQKLAGTCAAKLGMWEQAHEHLTRALELNADRDIHMMLGNVYYQTGRDELAQEQYKLAIQKSGATPPHQAHSGLADIYARQGETAQALEMVDGAITWADADQGIDPATYRLQKVRILMDADRMEDATALLQVLQFDEPQSTYTVAGAKLLARMWAYQGKPERIAGWYRNVYEAKLDDPDKTPDPAELGELLAELAYWRLELGQVDAANDALRRLRAVRPNHPRLPELDQRLRELR